MLNKIFNKFPKLYTDKAINSLIENAKSKALKEKRESEFETRLNIFASQYEVGDYFISVTNEWSKIRVVRIIKHETFGKKDQMPISVVKDVFSGEELLSFSVLIPFSVSVLSALKKLNPFERYAIATKQIELIDDKEKRGDYDEENTLDELVAAYEKDKQMMLNN